MKKIILLTGILLALTTTAFAQVVKEGYERIMFPAFSLVYKDSDKATLIKLDEFVAAFKAVVALSVNIEDGNGNIMEDIGAVEVHTCHNDINQPCGEGKKNILDDNFKFDTKPEPKATPTPK